MVERGYLLVHLMFRHIASAEWEPALELSAQIGEYGRRFGDADLLAMGLCSQGRLLLMSGRVNEGLALLDEAMTGIAAGEVSPIFAGQIYCSMIEGCQEVSDFSRAAEWTDGPHPLVRLTTGLGAVHRPVRGPPRPDHAAPGGVRRGAGGVLAGDAAATSPPVRPNRLVLRWPNEPTCSASKARTPAPRRHTPKRSTMATTRSRTWRCSGSRADARQLQRGAIRRLLDEPHGPLQRMQINPACVEVLLAVGEVTEAADLVEELRKSVRDVGCDGLHALAGFAAGSHLLAMGDGSGALHELRGALRVWTSLSAPYEAARCRLLIGRALRVLGDEESALAELSGARRTFAELGAEPAEHEAAQLLHVAAPGGLTAREVEVLRLVAAGKTNPEIAAMLVLSEKTVARHLSNIFSKIDVRSRTAAAAFAFEKRLT